MSKFRITVFILVSLLTFTGPARSAGQWIQFQAGKLGSPAEADILRSDQQGVIVHIRTYGMYFGDILADGETYQWFDIPGYGHVSDVGKPALPARSFFIEIPYGVMPIVEVLESTSVQLDGEYNVLPVQEPLTDLDAEDGEAGFAKDRALYSRNTAFPKDAATLKKPGIIRGQRVVSLNVFPLKYNPVSRKIEAITDLKLYVRYLGPIDHKTGSEKGKLRSKAFKPIHEGLVLNSHKPGAAGGSESPPVEGGDGTDYLIITHDNFYDSVLLLADWKHKKGVMTKVVTLTEIASNPTAADIKNYIQDAYENWTPAPIYVLLVGDAEYVPLSDSANSTDLYYSTLDGSDYYPDVFLGRLPVDSSSVDTVVSKIISYERTPDMSTNWYDDVLIAAYFEDNDNDGKAERFFLQTSEEIHSFLLGEDYICDTVYTTNSTNPQQYFNGDPIPSGLDFSGTTQDIIASVNEGVIIAQHRDHGSISGWWMPSFTTGDVPSLTNGGKLPVVFSINCLSGKFDDIGDCFCESILKKSNGGALAAVGATKVSYSGYNDEMAKGFYDAIWPDLHPTYSSTRVDSPTYHLGAIMNYGKFSMYDNYVLTGGAGYPWDPYDEYTQDEFEMFHLNGDPELSIITQLPQMLSVSYPAAIPLGQETIQVEVSSGGGNRLDGALVCVMKAGEVYEVAQTVDGAADITMGPAPATTGDLDITVTYHNYIPEEATCQVIPAEGSYLVYESHVIDDYDGNKDEEANPGETVRMAVTLRNFGIADATNVSGTITTESTDVIINEGFAHFDDIPAGETRSLPDPYFDFTIKTTAPYGAVVTFALAWTSNEGSGQTSFDVPIAVLAETEHASGDMPVHGEVTGSYLDTHAGDGVYQEIKEVLSNRGAKGTSWLEHKWIFNLTGGSDRTAFYVKAHRSANTEGDSFAFSYSADDITYQDMLTIGSASDVLRHYELPQSVSGTVYIKVVDTDRTPKNTVMDTVSIDEMYIRVVLVPNSPPVADANGPYSGIEDTEVQFDGSGSYDPENDPLTYRWDFGDGTEGTGENPVHIYTESGAYLVELVVNDGRMDSQGSITSAGIVYVNDAPQVTITSPEDGSTFVMDEPITFEGTATDEEDGDLTAGIMWTSDKDGGIGEGGSFTATLSAGTHTITASVTDSGDGTGKALVTVNVVESKYMSVSAIDMSLSTKGVFVRAIAVVTVVDQDGNRLSGATVCGHWEGNTSDIDTGTTESGTVTLESDEAKKPESGSEFILIIENVALDGWKYVPDVTSKSVPVP